MLNQETIQRLTRFASKVSYDKSDIYLEKFLKKLNAEDAIQGYRVIGKSIKANLLSLDIKQTEWYRVCFYYNIDGTLAKTDILNQEDLRDIFSALNQVQVGTVIERITNE